MCVVLTIGNRDSIPRRSPIPSTCAIETDCGWGQVYTWNPSPQEAKAGQPAPLEDPV